MRLSRVSNASGLFLVFNSCLFAVVQAWGVEEITSAQLGGCHRLPVPEDRFLLQAGGKGLSGFATPISSTLALSGLGWFS